MKLKIFGIVVAIFVSAAASANEKEAMPTEGRLELRDALKIAGENNLDIKIAEEDINKARAERRAIRGNYGPKLILDANLQVWHKKAEADFADSMGGAGGPQGQPPAFDSSAIDTSGYPEAFRPYVEQMSEQFGAAMGAYIPQVLQYYLSPLMNTEPVTVRDQVTSRISVNLVQPLTPLYSVYQGHRAAIKGEEASELEKIAAGRNIELEVISAYYNLLAAQKGVEITQAAIALLEAHKANAKKFYDAGLIGKNEYLQAEIGLAEVNKKLVEIRAMTALARANLNRLLNLPHDRTTIPVDPYGDKFPRFALSIDDCIARGIERRIELKSMDKRLEQVDAGKKVAYWDMVPQLSAIASYMHNEGSMFQDKNEFFVGANLSWTFWEWGATYYKIDSAKSVEAQIRLRKEQLVQGLMLQIRKNYLDMRSAEEQLSVADVRIEQAEENFRIVSNKFEAGAATSTEVLDAQTGLMQARVEKATAYYTYLIARAALNNAIGAEEVSN